MGQSFKIKNIRLMRLDELLCCGKGLPSIGGQWWLSTRSPNSGKVMTAGDGGADMDGVTVTSNSVMLRPVLEFDRMNCPPVGNMINLYGEEWDICPGHIAVCRHAAGTTPFNLYSSTPDACDYEGSLAEIMLTKWAAKHGIITVPVSAKSRGAGMPSRVYLRRPKTVKARKRGYGRIGPWLRA